MVTQTVTQQSLQKQQQPEDTTHIPYIDLVDNIVDTMSAIWRPKSFNDIIEFFRLITASQEASEKLARYWAKQHPDRYRALTH